MTLTMFDSVTIDQIPSDAKAVAGYVGGLFPTEAPLVKRFPHAKHLSIAVNSGEDADCLDIENGDAVPADAPSWVRRQRARGVTRPVLYANASEMPTVVQVLNSAGISRTTFRLWLAHFTFVAPSFPFEQGADGVQFTDRAFGRNLDESVLADTFFTGHRIVPAKNSTHYEWFDTGPFVLYGQKVDERAVVEEYDRLRRHPLINRKRLGVLERELLELAGRVYTVSHAQPRQDGRPSWNLFRRGWRFQQLTHRAQGRRFV